MLNAALLGPLAGLELGKMSVKGVKSDARRKKLLEDVQSLFASMSEVQANAQSGSFQPNMSFPTLSPHRPSAGRLPMGLTLNSTPRRRFGV